MFTDWTVMKENPVLNTHAKLSPTSTDWSALGFLFMKNVHNLRVHLASWLFVEEKLHEQTSMHLQSSWRSQIQCGTKSNLFSSPTLAVNAPALTRGNKHRCKSSKSMYWCPKRQARMTLQVIFLQSHFVSVLEHMKRCTRSSHILLSNKGRCDAFKRK